MEPTLLQSGEVADVGVLVDALNYTWVLVVCFLIFFMHAGFAMLEAGQVRSKNVANQLTKNLLTWSVGVVAFFLVGAGVSSLVGGGGFTWIAGEDPGSWANGWFLRGRLRNDGGDDRLRRRRRTRETPRVRSVHRPAAAAVIYPVVTGDVVRWYFTFSSTSEPASRTSPAG